jgi:hypothetical protein
MLGPVGEGPRLLDRAASDGTAFRNSEQQTYVQYLIPYLLEKIHQRQKLLPVLSPEHRLRMEKILDAHKRTNKGLM